VPSDQRQSRCAAKPVGLAQQTQRLLVRIK
jgi:hypothetical protein